MDTKSQIFFILILLRKLSSQLFHVVFLSVDVPGANSVSNLENMKVVQKIAAWQYKAVSTDPQLLLVLRVREKWLPLLQLHWVQWTPTVIFLPVSSLTQTPLDSYWLNLQLGWWRSLPQPLTPMDYNGLPWSLWLTLTAMDSIGLDSRISSCILKVEWFPSNFCSYSFILFTFKLKLVMW
jgi:hypothetical protein